MKAVALWLTLTTTALIIGFGLAWVVLAAVNAALPPFGIEDDDTLRERIPVALAYGTWAMTTLVGAVLSWRWVRRRRS